MICAVPGGGTARRSITLGDDRAAAISSMTDTGCREQSTADAHADASRRPRWQASGLRVKTYLHGYHHRQVGRQGCCADGGAGVLPDGCAWPMNGPMIRKGVRKKSAERSFRAIDLQQPVTYSWPSNSGASAAKLVCSEA